MSLLEKIRTYIKVSGVGPISRRYFLMNGFDGTMVTLGVVIASFVAGINSAYITVIAALGAIIAMSLSGFASAYVTEEAERSIIIRGLEKSMLRKLSHTLISRANSFAVFWAAFVNAAAPIASAMVPLIPFFLSMFNLLPVYDATLYSISVSLASLFILGLFLGKMAKKNIVISGAKMLGIGALLLVILFALRQV